jgi:hypothetical protein
VKAAGAGGAKQAARIQPAVDVLDAPAAAADGVLMWV